MQPACVLFIATTYSLCWYVSGSDRLRTSKNKAARGQSPVMPPGTKDTVAASKIETVEQRSMLKSEAADNRRNNGKDQKDVHESTVTPAASGKTTATVHNRPAPVHFALEATQFHKVRNAIGFVDKSMLLHWFYTYTPPSHTPAHTTEVTLNPGRNVIILAPPKLGKSVNLDMIRTFSQIPRSAEEGTEIQDLFQGLKIMNHPAIIQEHFQKHPVVYFDFKEIRVGTFAEFHESLRMVIDYQFHEYYYIKEELDNITEGRFTEYRKIPDSGAYLGGFLCQTLHSYFRERCILVVDNYDSPIESALFSNNINEDEFQLIVSTLSTFLGCMVKGIDIEGSYITGVSRIGGVVSEYANNLNSYSIFEDPVLSKMFGFEKDDIEKLAAFLRADYSYKYFEKQFDNFYTTDGCIFRYDPILQYFNGRELKFALQIPYLAFLGIPEVAMRISAIFKAHLQLNTVAEVKLKDLQKLKQIIQPGSENSFSLDHMQSVIQRHVPEYAEQSAGKTTNSMTRKTVDIMMQCLLDCGILRRSKGNFTTTPVVEPINLAIKEYLQQCSRSPNEHY